MRCIRDGWWKGRPDWREMQKRIRETEWGWRDGGIGWGKKKEERIKRRVAVVLPIDNGFHLYNSTPRTTLNPFCLFSLMLFYHPFAAVFHVSPITCHPRTYALFFRQNSLLSFSSRRSLLMSLLLRFCYRTLRFYLFASRSTISDVTSSSMEIEELYGNDSRLMNFIHTNRC